MPTFTVAVIANNEAGQWASWPQKLAAIKAFYAPVCSLDLELIPASLTPQFSPYEGEGVYVVDEAWYEANVLPLAAGADIAMLVVPPSDHAVPCLAGIETANPDGIWETTVFSDEASHAYVDGADQGENAVVFAEHELSHAFYAMLAGVNGGPGDNTHKYFYSGTPSGVLQDLDFGAKTVSLYQQLVGALQALYAALKAKQQPIMPIETAAPSAETAAPAAPNPDVMLPWDNLIGSQNNRHNVRVLCDQAGLSLYAKDVITACVQVESDFYPKAVNFNRDPETGAILSTDYGIVQINDYYHIGSGKDFPSVEYVIDNPAADVNWMIQMYQKGLIKLWCSYSSGAYLKYMPQA